MKDSFLQQTARAIVGQIEWRQLNRTTLVLPSHRAGVVLKDELLRLQEECHQEAVWAPEVLTLQQLQDKLSPLYAEDELMTVVRLYKLFSQSPAANNTQLTLDRFYNWGRQLLADFTNIDASMPAEQVPAFFANAIAAHELEQLDLDPEVEERLRGLISGGHSYDGSRQSLRAQYEALWRQLDTLYTALHGQMSAENKGYSGMRQRAVIEQWDADHVQQQIEGRTYVFVGFNYLLPVERELMEHFRDSGQALFFWDFVPDFRTNGKAFYYAKRNSGILGNSSPRLSDSPSFPRPATVIACTSREAQAQYVHQWLIDNYTEHGQKTGIVICEESMLEPVIYTLPAIRLEGDDAPSPVNITKGFPLRNTQAYARVIEWLYDKARGDAGQTVTPGFIGQLLEELNRENAGITASGNSDDELTWKELLILESEYQVRKVANQMKQIIADGIGDVPFTLKLLRLLMRRVMEGISMPFHGEPVTDIQVMGVLETRLLDFDKLLILNVEEGVIPQRQADSSFIPYYLRKAYSMQTPEERSSVYAYNFFRLLSRAGHSTLLFTTTDGAENSKGLSRFVMQMLVSPEFNVTKQNMREANVLTDIDDARLGTSGISLRSMLHTDEKNRLLREDGSPFFISPSAINTYISCPRQFCLQYIQGLEEPEKKEPVFSPATMGSFVHEAMQYIYETELQCQGKRDVTVSPDETERIRHDDTVLEEALAYAYRTMNEQWEKHHPGQTDHYLPEEHKPEKPVILQYIRNLLAHDSQDAQNGLRISFLEQYRSFDIDLGELGVLATGGRVDRVDICGTGDAERIRIVDYKSGSFNPKYMETTTAELMSGKEARYIRQTLIYSHAVMAHQKAEKRPIEPNLFFCSKPMDGVRTTVSIDGAEITDYKAVAQACMEQLKTILHELLTVTDFPPCSAGECSPFCPFLELCRRKAKEW